MMDPFSALAVATSVIQIVDFSSKILRDARTVYKRGSICRSDELLKATTGLRDLTEGLRTELQTNCSTVELTEDERVSSYNLSRTPECTAANVVRSGPIEALHCR